MAECCVQNGSAQCDKDSTIDWDVDLICEHIIVGNLAYDRKRLSWWNSLELLRKAIERIFVQRGKWWSPGGSAKRFDSSVSDFTGTWYPGKLNSLTFNGKIGEQAKDFLINLCVAMSISTEPRENVHDQTDLRTSMGKFNMDLEIRQSRFDSLQSLMSTHNDLLTGADDLVNEVTRMRLELEEEKAKTFMLEQQIKILSEEVMKSKPGIRQASPTKNTVSTLETNNTVQVSTISENNGLQTRRKQLGLNKTLS